MEYKEIKIDWKVFDFDIVGNDGNVERLFVSKFALRDSEGKDYTNYYYHMEELGNDHYAVASIVPLTYLDFHHGIGDKDKIAFKYGIICVQRNKAGKIIPKAEKLVTSYLYDRISSNNLKVATAYAGKHLTYIELDPSSKYYGKQLVPAILEHSTSFETPYEGFAEVSIDGEVGYLPRITIPIKNLTKEDLISEKQARFLRSFIKNKDYTEGIEKNHSLMGKEKTLKLILNK